MKILLDQNLSFRLIKKLSTLFSDVNHVKNFGLANSGDFEIYEFAKKNDFTILTFDADFFDISLLRGSPPKVIWLNTGNLTSKSVVNLIEKI